ncbi:PAS domain-containing protein [Halosimplex litoreum]|uniref:histidine kinase n=1 Tax=Halosimplex litoreum TaxID=1198301 RepID=A0A7T3KUI5_9EURY|nr:PAS domain-containing protein [Halosimplex litoreum]QPV62008.1 PAS domain-containing protein [Halosimplex litoreum]
MSGTDAGPNDRIRREALERVSDGIVALDEGFRYTYVNHRAEQILGCDEEAVLGECMWDVFPETRGTATEENLRAAATSGEQRSFERYNAALELWFDVRVYPDDSGLTVHFTDVTERKVYERELRASTRKLTALVESTSEAIYIKDRDGRYQFVNEAAADVFGHDPETVVGRTDEGLFDPESAAEIRELDDRIVEGDERDSRETVRYIDGVEHVFLDDKYPYHDEDGDVVGVMGISRDITDRKRRSRRLEALTEEYEAIFETAGDAIFLVDVEPGRGDGVGGAEAEEADYEFRFQRLNPSHEDTTGLTTDAVRGKTPREVLGEDLGAEVEANYHRCAETREPITYDEELELPEGRFVWETNLAPVVVDGRVARIVGIARDVTERVEQERELRRKNDRLDEFASVISHDLRNPLNVAQGRAAMLDRHCGGEALEHLEPTLEALDRMEAIVEDTLTLARQGETVGETDRIPLRALASQCWDLVETADATLDVESGVAIEGDRERLRHVFENLFRNAVEHGGPDVTVRVGRTDDGTVFVEDDGPGIDQADRGRVFEPGHTSVDGGTGFGLTIVRRIAQAHDWTVAVGDGPDGGARFELDGVDAPAG